MEKRWRILQNLQNLITFFRTLQYIIESMVVQCGLIQQLVVGRGSTQSCTSLKHQSKLGPSLFTQQGLQECLPITQSMTGVAGEEIGLFFDWFIDLVHSHRLQSAEHRRVIWGRAGCEQAKIDIAISQPYTDSFTCNDTHNPPHLLHHSLQEINPQ